MSENKTKLILITIVSIVIILIAIVITVYKNTPVDTSKGLEQNNLYFVNKVEESGYGICKTDGTVVVKPIYTQIARIQNSVYLKTETDSSIFFLDKGTSVSLGGKESEVEFAYDKEGKLLPYFILRYGESAQTSIYRIFDIKGERYDTKDFSSLNDAYKFLGAKEILKYIQVPTIVADKYNVVSTLNYPTSEGKTQYVVTLKDQQNGLQGIVDESGREILVLAYTKISAIQGSNNAIKVEKDNRAYLFFNSEKLIEVETGFDFETADGYFLQKRGTTVNKIYNLSGEVVVDGIYNINDDIVPLNLASGVSYMLVQEKTGIYGLYNVFNNKKNDTVYEKIVLDYISDYTPVVKSTSFIYQNSGSYYAVDLSNLKSYKMILKTNVYSPLDLGYVYVFK